MEGFDDNELKDIKRIFYDKEEEYHEALIDRLYKRIQTLESQVKAYRRRLNDVEACFSVRDPREKAFPCRECRRPLIVYCARCDK